MDVDEKKRYEDIIAKHASERADLSWRLVLATRFGQLMSKAYDALQAYGVDYRQLRTYKLWEHLLPTGATFDNPSAREAITGWLTKCSNDIDAAIRRRLNIKEVELHNDPD